MPIGHDPNNVNDPANDGSFDVTLNKFEDYPRWQNDQILWNGELYGVFPLAEEPAYGPADVTPDPVPDPIVPARPRHRIRHAIGHMFEELGKTYPSDVYYFF